VLSEEGPNWQNEPNPAAARKPGDSIAVTADRSGSLGRWSCYRRDL